MMTRTSSSLGLYVVTLTHKQPEPTRNYRFHSDREAKTFVKVLTKCKPSELTDFLNGKRTLTTPNGEITVTDLVLDKTTASRNVFVD